MDAEGLSTRDLAAKTGGEVSHSAIAQWLNGTNRATTEQAKHVADALGWDVYELLHGRPAADVIDRLAEMDAALRRVRRALSEATAAAAVSGTWHLLGEGEKHPAPAVVIRDEPEDAHAVQLEPARSATAPRKVVGGRQGRRGRG